MKRQCITISSLTFRLDHNDSKVKYIHHHHALTQHKIAVGGPPHILAKLVSQKV